MSTTSAKAQEPEKLYRVIGEDGRPVYGGDGVPLEDAEPLALGLVGDARVCEVKDHDEEDTPE
jgi:hypothetical protein